MQRPMRLIVTHVIAFLSSGLFASSSLAVTNANDAERPNVLLIVVDDMGYSDPGCYGGEIATPNIDRLAAEGVRLTQFYNCSRCCQTRASLLTGAYPHHVGMREFGRTMDKQVPTLAENLRDSGYSTAMVGKWHLSQLPDTESEAERILWMNHEIDWNRPFAEVASYPTRRGFEQFYGIIWGVVNHYDPFSLTDGEAPVGKVSKDYHATDAISQRSVEYLRNFASEDDKPFFLYVAYTAPHWPIQAPEKDIAKYRNRYQKGWEALRQERFLRQQEMGLFDEEATLGKISSNQSPWDRLPTADQEYLAEKMAVHAAMVDQVDQGIGQIIEQLRATDQLDNTIIFFLSDNGASPEIPGAPGYDRYSGTRDGRVALREGELRRKENRSKLGSDESYTGIGPSWASASNTPLRYWKAESYEGGCRSPLVIHWPDGIRSPAGGLVHDVGHVIDIAPTCYALAHAESATGTLQDGVSLVPLLLEKRLESDRTLYFQHGDGAAVRKGKWKASKLAGRDWQFFNVVTDPGETQDLSLVHPDLLKAYVEDWAVWSAGVSLDRRNATIN